MEALGIFAFTLAIPAFSLAVTGLAQWKRLRDEVAVLREKVERLERGESV